MPAFCFRGQHFNPSSCYIFFEKVAGVVFDCGLLLGSLISEHHNLLMLNAAIDKYILHNERTGYESHSS
jgi:hypothetical protein